MPKPKKDPNYVDQEAVLQRANKLSDRLFSLEKCVPTDPDHQKDHRDYGGGKKGNKHFSLSQPILGRGVGLPDTLEHSSGVGSTEALEHAERSIWTEKSIRTEDSELDDQNI